MGYDTRFNLTVKYADKITDINAELEAQLTKEIFRDWYIGEEVIPDTFLEIIGSDAYHWYEHEDDMRRVAAAHPDLYFILEGYGDEYDDIWTEVYHGDNFKRKYVEMIFPDERDMMEELDNDGE
jgi:hypothetical protein